MIFTGRQYLNRSPGDLIDNGAVLIERVDSRLWKIRCACGNIFIAQPSNSSGRCRECGYRYNSMTRTMHGESPDSDKNASRLYSIWLNMRVRCNNKHSKNYDLYGGRGITIAPEWNNYLSFKDWALSHGYDDSLSIDRINVNGNYEPNNCRWSTQKEQMRNTRNNHLLTYNGETKTMVEWAEEKGINYHTLKKRINKYHFSVEEALNLPAYKGNNQNLRSDEEDR